MMFTWGWRTVVLLILCGAVLWGLNYSTHDRLERTLSSLLGSDAVVGSLQYDTNGRIAGLSDVQIAGGKQADCNIAQVQLVSAPWSLLDGQRDVQRAIGAGVHLESSDTWSEQLSQTAAALVNIDPQVNSSLKVEPIDLAKISDDALLPTLVSWRSQWQGVLEDYQKQVIAIENKVPQEQSSGDAKNPLRDREQIKAHVASIEKLTQQLSHIEMAIQASKAQLADRAASLQSEGKAKIQQRLEEKQHILADRLKERSATNLEVLRRQLFAQLIREIGTSQHIVTNLAHRGKRVLKGQCDVVPQRGRDMLQEFVPVSKLSIGSLELAGVCNQPSAVSFAGAFYPVQESQDACGKFVVLCGNTHEQPGNRFTGSISLDDSYDFNGTITLPPTTLATDLHTEPNYQLSFHGGKIDIHCVATDNERQLELRWQAKNARLQTDVQDHEQKVDLAHEPIDAADCTAIVTIKFNDSCTSAASIDQRDNFFESFGRQLSQTCDKVATSEPTNFANLDAYVKTKVDQEYQSAIAALNNQTAKIGMHTAALSTRHQRLTTEGSPRPFRTATQTQGDSLIR